MTSAATTGTSAVGHRGTAWILAALFVAVAWEAVASDRHLHDEGILTFYFASLVRAEPLAGLFLQKLRPPAALFYAPVSALGFVPFAFLHVLVASVAIPCLYAVGRALGHSVSAAAAFIVAASPMLLVTAASGHTNADAVAGLGVALWLWIGRRQDRLAGALLGVLVFVRAETAPFALVIAVASALRGRRGVALGLPLFAVVYGALGALYHRDALWMLHFPPALTRPPPSAEWYGAGGVVRRLYAGIESLLVVTPAFAVLPWLRLRALAWEERVLGLGALLFVVAVRGLPLFGLFNFDDSPRYVLVVLPAAAVVLGRIVSDLVSEPRRKLPTDPLYAAAFLAALGLAQGGSAALLACLAVFTAAALVLGRGRVRAAAAMVLVGSAAWAFVARPLTRIGYDRDALRSVAAWLGAHQQRAVVTNEPLLRYWLSRHSAWDESRAQIHFVLNQDMAYELDHLVDASVGQGARLEAAMASGFYGKPLRIVDLEAGRGPDAWLVLTGGKALARVMPEARFRQIADVLWEGHGMLVGRMKGGTVTDAPR